MPRKKEINNQNSLAQFSITISDILSKIINRNCYKLFSYESPRDNKREFSKQRNEEMRPRFGMSCNSSLAILSKQRDKIKTPFHRSTLRLSTESPDFQLSFHEMRHNPLNLNRCKKKRKKKERREIHLL